jgi:hypothetical protein
VMIRKQGYAALLLAVIVAVVSFAAPMAAADPCRPYVGTSLGRSLAGLGHAVFLPTVATKLTDTPSAGVALDKWAVGAVISVEVQPIRYWTDGTVPTSTSGILIPAGGIIIFSPEQAQQLRSISFIETVSGAKVTVSSCW